jgi:hypothetical protein
VDAGQLGYAGVALNALMVGVVFIVLGLGLVGLDRVMARYGRT